MLAGRRAVISTGTKNLQEQLVRKDVPFLESALGQPLQVAVMKGRNNFVCIEKLAEQERKPSLSGLKETTEFALILEWAQRTETGDRADLEGLPPTASTGRLARAAKLARAKCGSSQCFVTKTPACPGEAAFGGGQPHLFFRRPRNREEEDDFGASFRRTRRLCRRGARD